MRPLLSILSCLLLAGVTRADVSLPKVIDSKMVLQRDTPVPVWGWADAGETVTVEFAGQVKTAAPDAAGRWTVRLDPLAASAEPRKMVIRGSNEIVLTDVLVGEVWLASGQSNMEWTFSQIVPEEWAHAQAQRENPNLRAFHVSQHLSAGIPLDDTIGSWKTCAEIVAVPHSLSAVGFFFALKLQEELGIPVAILDANWGGQRIESFIPPEGYDALNIPFRTHHAERNPEVAARRLRQLAADVTRAAEAAEQGRRIPYPDVKVYGRGDNHIYNAMIAPLTPYGIRGAIWYQGESNRGQPDYFQKLQALSAGWSAVFGIKDIPLYQVQIAPYRYNRQADTDSTLCDTIWTAQYRGAAEIPGMGIVAIHDTNINVLDIHPRHKRTVGERLAAQALKNHYGRSVPAAGPRFAAAVQAGQGVSVTFSDIDRGLETTDGAAPAWFELSADGQNFVSATALITNNTVQVSAEGIDAARFVRMGWDDAALPTLRDANGWPVFAFPASPVAPATAAAAESAP